MITLKRVIENITFSKTFFRSKTKRVLLENFVSLSFLQIADYIFPLIILPYLVRVLGPEKYGLIAFAQAFVSYFMILTDYGFNLSAPREISINREDKQKLSEIFSSIITIKFSLFMLSFVFISAIIFLFKKFNQDWVLYYLTFSMVLGYIMFPTWFFQGVENMKLTTVLNFMAKLIFTVSIFVFVKKQTDYYLVPLLNSLGFITAGIISLYIVFERFGIKFEIPSKQQIIHQLKEGWHIFISTIAINLYTRSNTFILGLLTNSTIVGYYTAAEKLIRAAQALLIPISQTVYPHISKVAKESKEAAIMFIKKLAILIASFTFFISVIIFIFADLIVKFVLGTQYLESIIVLRILAFLPFIIALSNVFGIQGLIAFGNREEFMRIVIIASIINLILLFIFTPFFKHIAVAIIMVLVEIYITSATFLTFKKLKKDEIYGALL